MPGKAEDVGAIIRSLSELYRKYITGLPAEEMDALKIHLSYPEDVSAGMMEMLEGTIAAGPRTPKQLRVYRGAGMEDAPIEERRLFAYPMATSLDRSVARGFGDPVQALTMPEGSPGLLLTPQTTPFAWDELYHGGLYPKWGEAEMLIPTAKPGTTEPARFYRHPGFEGDVMEEFTYRPPYKARGGLAQVGDMM